MEKQFSKHLLYEKPERSPRGQASVLGRVCIGEALTLRNNSSQHSPISVVLTVGKTTDCEGEGAKLRKEGLPGIAEMHRDRERIHTNGGNYLWYCKGEKEISSNMLVCVTRL